MNEMLVSELNCCFLVTLSENFGLFESQSVPLQSSLMPHKVHFPAFCTSGMF